MAILEITPTISNPPPENNGQRRNRHPNRWVRMRSALREPLSEFFGVFTLIIFGDGVVAQVVLSKGTKGDYQSISWGYALLSTAITI